MTITLPPSLTGSITFGLCSPSSWIENKWLDAFKETCAKRGLAWKVGRNMLARSSYKAGSARARADDLMDMFTDAEVDVVLATSGGFNAIETLELLDWGTIRSSRKWFVGSSDLTAVTLGLASKSGMGSIYGFNAVYAASDHGALDRLLLTLGSRVTDTAQPEELWEWDAPERRKCPPLKRLKGKDIPAGPALAANMSTFNLLLGTPYMPDLRGAVLCLEYDKEEAHGLPSLERMLWQIRAAGLFSMIDALVFGAPQKSVIEEERREQRAVETIVREATEGYDLTVIINAPFGHIYPSWQIINGAALPLPDAF